MDPETRLPNPAGESLLSLAGLGGRVLIVFDAVASVDMTGIIDLPSACIIDPLSMIFQRKLYHSFSFFQGNSSTASDCSWHAAPALPLLLVQIRICVNVIYCGAPKVCRFGRHQHLCVSHDSVSTVDFGFQQKCNCFRFAIPPRPLEAWRLRGLEAWGLRGLQAQRLRSLEA